MEIYLKVIHISPHYVFIFLCAHSSFHLPFPPFCLLLLVLTCYVFDEYMGESHQTDFLPIQLSILRRSLASVS